MSSIDLDDILNPYTQQEFFEKYAGKSFLHIPGEPSRFAGLLTWEQLNQILELKDISGHLSLFLDGKAIPADSYVQYGSISSGDLTGLLRKGATMVINQIDEMCGSIGLLAQRLGRVLQGRAGANLYAAWRLSHGFGAHWDDHDVLVLQLHGRKHWQILGESASRFPLRVPSREERAAQKNEPVWEGCLNPGDVLYIPRGWWHFAKPCDEPTVHLTIGIFTLKGLDLLRWLADRLSEQECVRMDLPQFADQQGQDAYLAELRRVVTEAVSSPALLRDFLAIRRGGLSGRPLFGLPHSAMPQTLPAAGNSAILLNSNRFLEPVRVANSQEIEITFQGNSYRYDAASLPLFETLNTNRELTVNQFYRRWDGEFERETLSAFLAELVRDGMITVRDSGAEPGHTIPEIAVRETGTDA